MHNEFKTLGYLIKYIENKLNGDMKLNRLMRYLSPYPYKTKSLSYDEGSTDIIKQPDITEKLLVEFNNSEKCLYCRDSNMENYPVEEMPTIFVHPTFIYFGNEHNMLCFLLTKCNISAIIIYGRFGYAYEYSEANFKTITIKKEGELCIR